jgi:hypothetical protein
MLTFADRLNAQVCASPGLHSYLLDNNFFALYRLPILQSDDGFVWRALVMPVSVKVHVLWFAARSAAPSGLVV